MTEVDIIVEVFRNAGIVVTPSIAVIGGIWAVRRFYKNRIDDAFKRGKQEETCLKNIENTAKSALTKIESVEETLASEVRKSSEIHRITFEKLDKVEESVNIIKGKIELLTKS